MPLFTGFLSFTGSLYSRVSKYACVICIFLLFYAAHQICVDLNSYSNYACRIHAY